MRPCWDFTALLGLGALTDAWIVLVLLLAIAGVGITVVQVGANVLVARAVPFGPPGFAFGAKQKAVPLASFVAGLPRVGLTLGWQPTFAFAAIAVPIIAWSIPDAVSRTTRLTPGGDRRVPTRALVLLTVGVPLAGGGGKSAPAGRIDPPGPVPRETRTISLEAAASIPSLVPYHHGASMQRSTMGETVAVAIAATTVVALPTLLVGGLAVLIQRDLQFGEAELGTAIAISFVAAAITAAPAGRLVERIGPRRTSLIGLACGFISLLGLGLTSAWATLLIFLAVAGIGVTTVQVGVNVLLARGVPQGRQGLAFGAKQAAVPLASLLAGLALPVVGLTLGWQVAFLLGAAVVPVVAWRMPDATARDGGTSGRRARAPLTPALLLLTVGVAMAAAGGNSTPAFVVPSLVDRGFEPAIAGLVLAAGSLVGIVVRVSAGWVSDRLGRGSLLIVVGMISVGVLGYLGLALGDHPAALVVSVAVAFGGGWGWGGLIPLAISRIYADAPSRAMGVVQVGPMSGAVLGPFVFGALADGVSFMAAWFAMAGFAGIGIAAIAVSRRWLVRERTTAAEPASRSATH